MKYNGKCTSKLSNETYQTGSNEPEFFIHDTIVKPLTFSFKVTNCGGKTKLTGMDVKEIALSTNGNYIARLEYLKKEGYVDRLEKMK